ncbi:MAG: hypothetical protein LC808_00335 [Actinobacteria bacterium]|nr:hypothetical protein [Actinomycetota bacterium]
MTERSKRRHADGHHDEVEIFLDDDVGSRWTRDYIKICGRQHELEEFARSNVGSEARTCGLCF